MNANSTNPKRWLERRWFRTATIVWSGIASALTVAWIGTWQAEAIAVPLAALSAFLTWRFGRNRPTEQLTTIAVAMVVLSGVAAFVLLGLVIMSFGHFH